MDPFYISTEQEMTANIIFIFPVAPKAKRSEEKEVKFAITPSAVVLETPSQQ